MGNARLVAVIAGLIFFVAACIPGRYLKVDDSSEVHQHVKLKFFFQDPDKRQNGKILMKFDRDRSRILFLSSLNQVYFELLVEKEVSWLINIRKKKFWKGKFRKLIADMWHVDLTLDELKRLLTEGMVPEKKLTSTGFDFFLQTDPVSGSLRQIKIFDRETTILLKVQDRRVRSGGISFNRDFSGLEKGDLDTVLMAD